MKLIPVQYHSRKYPFGIIPQIKEVAGHFDVERIDTSFPFSLHTEYCFTGRKLSSSLINSLFTIKASHNKNIPKLWFSKTWAKEFSKFIIKLTGKNSNLMIVEIHPPFNDYCESFDQFIDTYNVFENEILEAFPKADILIENRFGSQYRGGKFILSSCINFLELSQKIEASGVRLRMILDVPQLFTRHFGPKEKSQQDIINTLSPLKECSEFIKGIHLWGKRRSDSGRWISHVGNLNTYFDNDASIKARFLKELFNVFEDNNTRYFVPEVNSSDEDLKSIIQDLKKTGFIFV